MLNYWKNNTKIMSETQFLNKKKDICFVISPIDKEYSDIRKNSDKLYNHILKPVIEKLGYEITRSDKISQPGMITTQILSYVINSELVIADLSEYNANVFYELAIRHATKKHYIQVIRRGYDIPFDLKNTRTIFYDFDIEEAENAKTKLEELLVSSQGMGEVENPISNAINFQAFNVSEDPNKQVIGRIFEMVQNMNSTLESIKDTIKKENKGGINHRLNLKLLTEYEKLLDDWKTVLYLYDNLDNYLFKDKEVFNDVVNRVRTYFPNVDRFKDLNEQDIINTRIELLKLQMDLRDLYEQRKKG